MSVLEIFCLNVEHKQPFSVLTTAFSSSYVNGHLHLDPIALTRTQAHATTVALPKQQYKMLSRREAHAMLGDVIAPLDRSVIHIPSTLATRVLEILLLGSSQIPKVLSTSFLLLQMAIHTVIRDLRVAFELYGIFTLVTEHTLA